jgi:hypothetical protein
MGPCAHPKTLIRYSTAKQANVVRTKVRNETAGRLATAALAMRATPDRRRRSRERGDRMHRTPGRS